MKPKNRLSTGPRASGANRAACVCRKVILALLLGGWVGGAAFAASNDATAALQKGLFEEEANHDFNAAIREYQAVVRQFEQDRKVAATAVFRLGECYRKQGHTNEANAQYERILKDFADQTPLVALSRSYVGASGQSAGVGPAALAPGTSEEAEEVRRIRAMIKDSPDLINARDHGGRTPLQQAAEKGQVVVATFLLENGAEVNVQDGNGQSPLHLATGQGHKALVELLLDHKADVQAESHFPNEPTALHLAARKGFRSLLELLIEHKADVNAHAGAGPTPLHLATAKGFKAIAQVLIQSGADVNAVTSGTGGPGGENYRGTPLHIAATTGDEGMTQLLLDNKADPNFKLPDGVTPLHDAANAGKASVAKLLLAHGAAINARTETGVTPLASAVLSQHAAEAKVLLEAGADPNIPFETGAARQQLSPTMLPSTERVMGVTSSGPYNKKFKHAPLFYAVRAGTAEIVELLLKHGANPNVKDEGAGRTPVLIAIPKPEMVSLLLEARADPNIPGPGGTRPLHEAVGEPAIEELLLKHGAEVNGTNELGETALHWAAGAGFKETAELLLANGAEVNARDLAGNTPLVFAIVSGKADTASLLLAKGANPNVVNRDGSTPLDFTRGMQIVNWVGVGNRNFARPAPASEQPSSLGSGTFTLPRGRDAATSPTQVREALAAELKAHGALANLPHLDRIEASRRAANYSTVVFMEGTNTWNHFTLLDLLGVEYELLAGDPDAAPRSSNKPEWVARQKLVFPDLAHVRIRKPQEDAKNWDEHVVDVTAVFSSGDCAKNIPLAWGEVVEIPEADHPLNERWQGFSSAELTNVMKCLSREVQVVIKGNATRLTLGPVCNLEHSLKLPDRTDAPNLPLPRPLIVPGISEGSLWLKPALRNSNLLLASSDLSRVKVTRRDTSGQVRQWVLDCSESKPGPALWLQNNDVIEVPEKP